jgi:hypothetical protein
MKKVCVVVKKIDRFPDLDGEISMISFSFLSKYNGDNEKLKRSDLILLMSDGDFQEDEEIAKKLKEQKEAKKVYLCHRRLRPYQKLRMRKLGFDILLNPKEQKIEEVMHYLLSRGV